METTNSTEPAKYEMSKRQSFALFCIYKKDFRKENLTKEQVDELFKNAPKRGTTNTGTGKKETLWDFMTKPENVNKMVQTLAEILGIVSVVQNDTNYVKDDGKRYVFFGGGCGFSFIQIDKRNKRGQAILEQWRTLQHKYKDLIVNKALTTEQKRKLEALGSPIGAITMQDLHFNTTLNNIVANYLEQNGVTVKNVTSNLD